MRSVAVIAHSGKTLGGGLPELRRVLAARGIEDPIWREVPKSKKAPAAVRKALKAGADHFFLWGGDGLAQRCIDVLAGTGAVVSIVPAGTANLLASNLGIPKEIEGAVDVGLAGERRHLDVARVNGEGFAVMAGAGFDARMIGDADGSLKDRFGRLAYVATGARNLRSKPFGAKVVVDGATWFDGSASCVLVGNVGKLFGGLEPFQGASPEDGLLEVGVVTADGVVDWLRTMTRAVVGDVEKSPFTESTKGHRVRVKLDRKVPYELDGGDRKKVRDLRIEVEPGALEICVPRAAS